MFRRLTPSLYHHNQAQATAPIGNQTLDIRSPTALLRMLIRSIDICVKSRHAKNFMRKRLMVQWRMGRDEIDPDRQRFLMERAGAFLQILHTTRTPTGAESVQFQLSRIEAAKVKEAIQLKRQSAESKVIGTGRRA
eukprot:GILI01026948.1.p1 GENE.GILI01026948.1~~GILI01026948.1.p1  ORF type:complete len:136 (+),score=17.39 GILI01026948.1:79-486(+)